MPQRNTLRYWIVVIGIPLAVTVASAWVTAQVLGNNAREQLDQFASVNSLLIAIMIAVLSVLAGNTGPAPASPPASGRRKLRVLLPLTVMILFSVVAGVGGMVWLDRDSAREARSAGTAAPGDVPDPNPSRPPVAATTPPAPPPSAPSQTPTGEPSTRAAEEFDDRVQIGTTWFSFDAQPPGHVKDAARADLRYVARKNEAYGVEIGPNTSAATFMASPDDPPTKADCDMRLGSPLPKQSFVEFENEKFICFRTSGQRRTGYVLQTVNFDENQAEFLARVWP
ncbi:hypothetical protein [Jidongwangia harbinensis]|uniref:hypothetical protein n=1 Tax=Jidongwangia harbinensis TaxID=2878561 RepID=UPI001CD94BAF|nr:hypothetical protein [Jidongwangia harbinensis]MCA2214874.1 hypothetical protein [Jidongwangia harbinensis]